MGSGRVQTDHGYFPVQTQATVLLLLCFSTFDDCIPGERITPTGAAILRYLRCVKKTFNDERRLIGTGVGFGSRELRGISNVLRVLVFDESLESKDTEKVAVIH